MKLEEKLLFLRGKRGLTQADAAEALKVSRQAVSRWETGAVVPSAENLKYLSRLYGVSVDDLLNEDCLFQSATAQVRTVNEADEPPEPPEQSDPPEVPGLSAHPASKGGTWRERIKRHWILILILVLALAAAAVYIRADHESREPLKFGEIGSDDWSGAKRGEFNITW